MIPIRSAVSNYGVVVAFVNVLNTVKHHHKVQKQEKEKPLQFEIDGDSHARKYTNMQGGEDMK